MIKEINTIAFIFLCIFLIGAVSAAEVENETVMEKTSDVNIDSHDVNMYYKDGTRFNVSLSDSTQNPLKNTQVTFAINGASYNRTTNDNGQASLALNLNSGQYLISTILDDNVKNNTVIIKSTIEADDLVKVYRNASQYNARFVDKSGNALKNTAVSFNINGVFYTRQSNDDGIARLNINLNQGTYILTAMNPQTTELKANVITVLPTITENRDIVKYYRNATQYTVRLISGNGNSVGLGEIAKFNINGIIYERSTNTRGVASLNLNLNPGHYIITAGYGECRVSNKIEILSTLDANNIEMNYRDGTKFRAYLVDGRGNPSWNKDITFNINGVFYTRQTDEYGVASLNINLNVGEYIITSEYNGLRISNWIIITSEVKENDTVNTGFTYEVAVPNYVNVTYPYVLNNSYAVKSGTDGIISVDKNQLFTVQIGPRSYSLTTSASAEYSSLAIGHRYHLLAFDGSGIQSNANLSKLNGNGIIFYNSANYTHIIYRNNCSSNVEQFGVYIDKDTDKSESIYYIQNGRQVAKVNFRTLTYDEEGLKYNLATYHGTTLYSFNYKNYDEVTKGNADKIRFAKTNESVTFSMFGNYIVGYLSEEDIVTRFDSDNCVGFEKSELITMGLSNKYKNDFDVLQSFVLVNTKITSQIMENWLVKESEYKSDVGMQSIYAMFMTGLNTIFLSDELADNLSSDYDVKWSRNANTVVMGGMNWENVYLHVLTPGMARSVEGDDETNIIKFRFADSIYLSKIEQYCLEPIAEEFEDNVTTAFDNVFKSLESFKSSVVFYNNTAFIFDEGGSNSTFVIDLKTGLVTPLTVDGDFAYKGTTVNRDCGLCSILSMFNNVMRHITNNVKTIISNGKSVLNTILNNIHPITVLSVKGGLLLKGGLGVVLGSATMALAGVFGSAVALQSIGVYTVNHFVEDEDVHTAYEYITFTRPGPFEDVKFYNIPNDDGSVDYIEIPINNDNTLDRDNTRYISNGNIRKLTREETYQYFTEETWTPFNVPQKYWKQ